MSDGVQFYATFYNAPPAIKVSGAVIMPDFGFASPRVFFFFSFFFACSRDLLYFVRLFRLCFMR